MVMQGEELKALTVSLNTGLKQRKVQQQFIVAVVTIARVVIGLIGQLLHGMSLVT